MLVFLIRFLSYFLGLIDNISGKSLLNKKKTIPSKEEIDSEYERYLLKLEKEDKYASSTSFENYAKRLVESIRNFENPTTDDLE